MDYNEFQRHIGKAGLRLNEFANLMQMTPTSLSNYRKKNLVPVHLAVIAVLLGELADNGIDYRAALAKIVITPKKARGTRIDKASKGSQE